jgi:hypothetical protein
MGPVDPFGFSWRTPFWPRKPPFLRVGKAWISLDSLVRIEAFQWVTKDFRWKKISRALFPKLRSCGEDSPGLGMQNWDRSSGKLNSFSNFLQSIADRVVLVMLSVKG